MSDTLAIFLLVLVGNLLGYWAGWNSAHRTVAIECKRLGALKGLVLFMSALPFLNVLKLRRSQNEQN